MSDSRESVVLRTERGARALPLLSVVISGVASRQNISVDQLDDVQLAIESLVAEEPEGEGDFVLEVWADGGGLSLCLDGLVNASVREALLAEGAFQPCEDCLLDVRILLESLVDSFVVAEKSDGRFAVQMEKRA